MKQVIAGLLFAASLSNGQVPPAATTGAPQQPQQTTATPVVATQAATTAAPVMTTAPVTTATPIIATTAAPVPIVTTTAPVPPAPVPAPPAPAPPAQPTGPGYVPNPYCPPFRALEAMGQPNHPNLPLGFSTNQNRECRSSDPRNPASRAIDYQGHLDCNNWACCLCSEITCGASGWGCEEMQIGDSGAVGNQNINIHGAPTTGLSWSGYGWHHGARLDCGGLESCKATKVTGTYVGKVQCSGDYSCQGSKMVIQVAEAFEFQANGLMAAERATIELVIAANSGIAEINKIEFNGQQSAQSATIIINNMSPLPVRVHNLECMNPTACPNLQIQVKGNVYFENCDLMGMQNLHSLPPALQACAIHGHGMAPGMGMGQFYNPQVPPYPAQYQPYPQYTPFPQPQYPLAPVTPIQQPQQPVTPPQQPVTPPQQPQQPVTPPQQPVTPSTPSNPSAPAPPAPPATNPSPPAGNGQCAPVNSANPLMPINPQGLKCLTGECAGRDIRITPVNNWVFECLGNCNCMDMTITAGFDPMGNGIVDRLDAVKFIGAGSGVGATIRVKTNGASAMMGGFGMNQMFEIGDVRCEGIGSCRNQKWYFDAGVDITNVNFDCGGNCMGCEVYQAGNPNPMPCAMLTSNNNNMYPQMMQYGANYPYGQQPPMNQYPSQGWPYYV